MADLSHDCKLTARSIPLVNETLDRVMLRLVRVMRFRGRKLSREAVVNAAILILDKMDQIHLELGMRAALSEIEAALETAETTPSRINGDTCGAIEHALDDLDEASASIESAQAKLGAIRQTKKARR